MRKKIFITILIIISAGLVVYTWLGGFQEAIVKRVTLAGGLIMGKEFYGLAKSEKLGEIFGEVQGLLSGGKIKGVPAVIYYSLKSQKHDSVHAFVGILIKDSVFGPLPPNFKYKFIKPQQGLQAALNAHSVVLSSEKIENAHMAINDFAKKQKIKLQPFVVEKYVSEDEFLMEIPEKR